VSTGAFHLPVLPTKKRSNTPHFGEVKLGRFCRSSFPV
jgi:hypothetical protein